MRTLIVIFGWLFLGSCAAFIDARHTAGQVQTVGQSTATRPAVCYNPLWNDESERALLAEQECQKKNLHAVFQDTQYFSCCLFFPNTAFYQCQK